MWEWMDRWEIFTHSATPCSWTYSHLLLMPFLGIILAGEGGAVCWWLGNQLTQLLPAAEFLKAIIFSGGGSFAYIHALHDFTRQRTKIRTECRASIQNNSPAASFVMGVKAHKEAWTSKPWQLRGREEESCRLLESKWGGAWRGRVSQKNNALDIAIKAKGHNQFFEVPPSTVLALYYRISMRLAGVLLGSGTLAGAGGARGGRESLKAMKKQKCRNQYSCFFSK